ISAQKVEGRRAWTPGANRPFHFILENRVRSNLGETYVFKKLLHALCMGALLTTAVSGLAFAETKKDCSKIKDPTEQEKCMEEQDAGE
ncbi:MAG: hypothetical protein ACPHIA_04535, partial [Alphaproteobacteria bacterium]